MFRTTLETRFRDLDPMGHVNNAVYATYLEQARDRFFREEVGVRLADVETVLASLSIDYRAPVAADETVTVDVETAAVGTSSLTFAYEVRAGERVVAEAETVQVTLEDDEPTPLPEGIRAAAKRHATDGG